jgi:hypothetical protein
MGEANLSLIKYITQPGKCFKEILNLHNNKEKNKK